VRNLKITTSGLFIVGILSLVLSAVIAFIDISYVAPIIYLLVLCFVCVLVAMALVVYMQILEMKKMKGKQNKLTIKEILRDIIYDFPFYY
jgi:uncharacterized membrane-anchored protein